MRISSAARSGTIVLSLASAVAVSAFASDPVPPPAPGGALPPYMPGAAPPPAPGAPKYQEGPEASCVWTRQITDWQRVDDRRIMVRTSPSKRYMVTFNARCHDSRFSNSLGVARSFGSCLRPGDRLIFRRTIMGPADPTDGFGCVVASIRKITQTAER